MSEPMLLSKQRREMEQLESNEDGGGGLESQRMRGTNGCDMYEQEYSEADSC
jgi:hypothetical protein